MAMNIAGPHSGPAADMNVTPLIDVLLVLLIIFMIITPLTPLGQDALVPKPDKGTLRPVEPIRTVIVQILDNDGTPTLKINQEDVSWEGLRARLNDIFKERAERVLFVKADNTLDFSAVAQVIDTAHAVNVDKVGLITDKI